MTTAFDSDQWRRSGAIRIRNLRFRLGVTSSSGGRKNAEGGCRLGSEGELRAGQPPAEVVGNNRWVVVAARALVLSAPLD